MANMRSKVASALTMMLLLESQRNGEAFTPSLRTLGITQRYNHERLVARRRDPMRMMAASTSTSTSTSTLVVVSPPGGVGESTAVSAAKLGNTVKWFVISPPPSSSTVELSSAALSSIEAAGGSIELAGSDASSLLSSSSDSNNNKNESTLTSAMDAVLKWSGQADGVICTYDGIEESILQMNNDNNMNNNSDKDKEMMNIRISMAEAVRVVAKEISSKGLAMNDNTRRIAILGVDENPEEKEDDTNNDNNNNDDDDEGDGNFLTSLLGRNKMSVPSTLAKALGSSVITLRHGDLFGIPESSPNASPFLGGPRRDPVLCDEYTMRSIRIDPTISLSGNTMMGSSTRTSRLAMGEAAALMALSSTSISTSTSTSAPSTSSRTDLCLSSTRGLDAPTTNDWMEEFARVQEIMSSGKIATLFSTSFGSVPSIDRLTEWIATKWAPAVLRTYDIAGIRVGARPVYASRTAENMVQIVWQELVDFQSVTVGTMTIEIDLDGKGIVATRGPGDASKGYGNIASKPLPGENILVRRLTDAATQAMEKGLATKPAPKKRPSKKVAKKPTITTTVASSGTIEKEQSTPTTTSTTTPASLESGPRSGGARRSTERTRGNRRRKKTDKDGDDKSSETSWQ
eukprot:CAMPEP_0184859492 /NCGR_PEP_ID=MMETSP0580-20130426/4474_1 /TAXON_ID=1118495 /ORGANISM="Dactyliosolen fragilissimus" /LENGTH=628 /DNA_ID=CAMNT_0027356133 /DNA_START=118 /DNA_END=2004 /DNA_ORIENTATION=+